MKFASLSALVGAAYADKFLDVKNEIMNFASS